MAQSDWKAFISQSELAWFKFNFIQIERDGIDLKGTVLPNLYLFAHDQQINSGPIDFHCILDKKYFASQPQTCLFDCPLK